MQPWVTLDEAAIPGGATLRLKRRGREFSIMLGSNELMNSRVSGSETALATLGLSKAAHSSAPNVLIGGLGMGFTLRAALGVLPVDASVVVAELVPAVVMWAKAALSEVFDGCLDDPRVTLLTGDVRAIIATAGGRYDAILLDVDNGPDGLTASSNDGLYSLTGLHSARAALRPGGVLAVWSAHPDDAFRRRLIAAGFACEEKRARASGRGGAKHIIWLATRPA